jgi:NAD-dependent dihydropyrimidine dehydrogenase PreA subunit
MFRIEGQVKQKYSYLVSIPAQVQVSPLVVRRTEHTPASDWATVPLLPLGAITMEQQFPVVDVEKCVGCGSCVRPVPRRLLSCCP